MLKRNYSKGLIQCRAELMGLGAIGVLITHSSGIVDWPSFLTPVVTYGGIGVYVFMFLSGFGMWYSLSLKDNVSIIDFYNRRWRKVFLPYIVIAGVWYSVKYLIIEHHLLAFFFELSTLSYWLEHKGAWYVAALIPIYLVYPLFYMLAENGKNRNCKYLITIIFLLAFESILYVFQKSLYDHIAQVLNSLWVFTVGSYFAKSISESNNDILWIVPSFLAVFIASKFMPLSLFTPIGGIIYALKGLVFTIIAAVLLDIVKLKFIHKLLAWLGDISLELYLTNIFCIQALHYFLIGEKMQQRFGILGGYLSYALVLVCGVLLSYLFHMIISRLIMKRDKVGKK